MRIFFVCLMFCTISFAAAPNGYYLAPAIDKSKPYKKSVVKGDGSAHLVKRNNWVCFHTDITKRTTLLTTRWINNTDRMQYIALYSLVILNGGEIVAWSYIKETTISAHKSLNFSQFDLAQIINTHATQKLNDLDQLKSIDYCATNLTKFEDDNFSLSTRIDVPFIDRS